MPNDSTIPSQLGPIDTMPSQLGSADGGFRPRRMATPSPWPRLFLIALAGALVVYLLGLAG